MKKAHIAVGLFLSGSPTWARTRDTRINRPLSVFSAGAGFSPFLVPQMCVLHLRNSKPSQTFAERISPGRTDHIPSALTDIMLCHCDRLVTQ